MKDLHRHLAEHYAGTFQAHGENIEGAGWGSDKARVHARWNMICNVFPFDSDKNKPQQPSILDVGCNYGGMYGYMKEQGIDVIYNGIDLSEVPVEKAKRLFPEANFICSDLDSFHPEETFDYVVACGAFGRKGNISHKKMHTYWKDSIIKMFHLCNRGIAFNVFTNRVNQFSPEHFYISPAEALSFCLENISEKVMIHHIPGTFDMYIYIYNFEF